MLSRLDEEPYEFCGVFAIEQLEVNTCFSLKSPETVKKAVKVRRAGLPGERPAQFRRIPGMPLFLGGITPWGTQRKAQADRPLAQAALKPEAPLKIAQVFSSPACSVACF